MIGDELVAAVVVTGAVDFTLPLATGNPFRLSEQRGKVVLLNFWATWCIPCREEMPALERLWRAFERDVFVVVGVSVDTNPAAASAFMQKHRLTFLLGLDPESRVALSYSVRAFPTTVIVGRDGKTAAVALGPRAWDGEAAKSVIRDLLARERGEVLKP